MHKISIIIPNYNKAQFLYKSLESLKRQTFQDWEAIIVDDCSTDHSMEILQKYVEKDSRFRLFANDKNRGGNFSRNFGLQSATGDYVIFLDSDDWLSDDCLQVRLAEFETDENSTTELLIFPMAIVENDKIKATWLCRNPKNALIGFLRHEIQWSIMMPMWRRKTLLNLVGFDETFPRFQDVELHTRALVTGCSYKIAKRTSPDCFYFTDENRMTMNYEKMASSIVIATQLYLAKMEKLIDESGIDVANRKKALKETAFQGIRSVGDLRQSGKITKEYFKIMMDDLNKLYTGGGYIIRFYAFAYRIGINRIHGFNFCFRRIFRKF